MSLRFSLLGLIVLTTLAGVASAALAQPSAEWLTVAVSLTAGIAIAQVLRAILFAGVARASAIGWLVFAAGYLAAAIGPIAGTELGPHLASTRGLGYAQVRWHREDPSAFAPVASIPAASAGYTSVDYLITDLAGIFQGPGAVIPATNYFLLSGHWLAALGAGWLGSAIASQLYERQSRPDRMRQDRNGAAA